MNWEPLLVTINWELAGGRGAPARRLWGGSPPTQTIAGWVCPPSGRINDHWGRGMLGCMRKSLDAAPVLDQRAIGACAAPRAAPRAAPHAVGPQGFLAGLAPGTPLEMHFEDGWWMATLLFVGERPQGVKCNSGATSR